MTKNSCRKCGAPCGAFKYCRKHRKANAAKARARYHSRKRLGRTAAAHSGTPAIIASAPTASEAYYRDQAERAKPKTTPA